MLAELGRSLEGRRYIAASSQLDEVQKIKRSNARRRPIHGQTGQPAALDRQFEQTVAVEQIAQSFGFSTEPSQFIGVRCVDFAGACLPVSPSRSAASESS